MSLQLIEQLNGGNRGKLRAWIDSLEREPRIAWYPSSGEDFRDLLYLSTAYQSKNPGEISEPDPPDLFLHTDYYPWSSSGLLDTAVLYSDDKTRITATDMEELPRCDLPLDPGIVDFPKGSIATGRVVFMWLKVASDTLGELTAPLLYVFAENAAFCAERMLPNNAKITHAVHMSQGDTNCPTGRVTLRTNQVQHGKEGQLR